MLIRYFSYLREARFREQILSGLYIPVDRLRRTYGHRYKPSEHKRKNACFCDYLASDAAGSTFASGRARGNEGEATPLCVKNAACGPIVKRTNHYND